MRQAIVALLRPDALQRLQRRPPVRCGPGPRRQPDAQERLDRGGPSPQPPRRSLARPVPQAHRLGKAGVRGAGGGGQSLDSQALPPDEGGGSARGGAIVRLRHPDPDPHRGEGTTKSYEVNAAMSFDDEVNLYGQTSGDPWRRG